jgi:hypothetical protein
MNPCGGWHYYKRVERYEGAQAIIGAFTFTSSTHPSSTRHLRTLSFWRRIVKELDSLGQQEAKHKLCLTRHLHS